MAKVTATATPRATAARTMLALLRESDRVLLRETWLRVGLVVVVVGVGDELLVDGAGEVGLPVVGDAGYGDEAEEEDG